MPLLEEQSTPNDNRDWMDIALEFDRESDGNWELAHSLAQNARRNGDNWGDERLAAAEHFLFARSFGNISPLHATAAAVAPIGYSLKKAVGIGNEDTPASFDQIQAGLAGAFGGLMGK